GMLLVIRQATNPPFVPLISVTETPPPAYNLWSMRSLGVQSLPDAVASGNQIFATLPLALDYHWGDAGDPTPPLPGTRLPADLAQPIPIGPVGNPDGDPTFTIWQPGEAALLPPLTRDPTFPGVFLFRTDFAAWSPGGSLVEPIELRGYLIPAPA